MAYETGYILYMDHSTESNEIRTYLESVGASFQIVYAVNVDNSVPSVKTPFGHIRGLDNVRRYFVRVT